MSEETPVTNYAPPQHVGSNTDIQTLIQQAVDSALAKQAAEQAAANAPRVLSPEEAARAKLDNRGFLLGVEERLQELYELVDHLAKKAGV